MKIRKATYSDVQALAEPVMPRKVSKALAVQALRSDMSAIEDAQGLAAVIGFYPLGVTPEGEAAFELWSMSRPGLGLGVVRFIVRLARVTMDSLAHAAPVAIVSRTEAGWIPGRKLHALIGMEPVNFDDAGFETFLWRSAGVETR